MKHPSTKTKATMLALLVCAQALLVGCATSSSTSTSEEDQAKLAKAEKMANRFETRPRLGN